MVAWKAILVTVASLAVGLSITVLSFRWLDVNLAPTHYCTEYTAVQSIVPVFEDNGKNEDESYIVKYADGTTASKEQGEIEPYRCTNIEAVKDNEPVDPKWKVAKFARDVTW